MRCTLRARADGTACSKHEGGHLVVALLKNLVYFYDMASEDAKDDLTEVNQEKEHTTENNDAATSDAKEESSDDKKTEKDGEEDEKEVKLYVGNLPDQCRRGSLKELFDKYGKVSQCDIVKNFAFVVSLSGIFPHNSKLHFVYKLAINVCKTFVWIWNKAICYEERCISLRLVRLFDLS